MPPFFSSRVLPALEFDSNYFGILLSELVKPREHNETEPPIGKIFRKCKPIRPGFEWTYRDSGNTIHFLIFTMQIFPPRQKKSWYQSIMQFLISKQKLFFCCCQKQFQYARRWQIAYVRTSRTRNHKFYKLPCSIIF